MPRRIDIAATASEALFMEADAFVVIDCLRATTTIAALFANGLHRLWTTADIEQARITARREQALLLGEVGGLRPDGFDYGNSPIEAAATDVRGRDGVLFTTNGTAALTGLADRGPVIAAGLVNAASTLAALVPYDRVVFVCAGEARGTRFALEDFSAAAHFVQRASGLWPAIELGDLALLGAEIPDPISLVARSAHAEVTRRLGFASDIAFATKIDLFAVVPRVISHGPGLAVLGL